MLKRSPLKKVSEKQRVKNKEKAEKSRRLHEWFIEIWKEREEFDNNGRGYVICFETGMKLYSDMYMDNSCCYHHLILKSKRPDLALESENLIIITPEVHSQTHINIDKTPKIKEITKIVKEKFD